MKKASCYKWMLSLCIAVMASIGVQAQSYVSKPTAIKNLADESKYITATLPAYSETNQGEYNRLAEKQRVILKVLKSLKHGSNVEQAVNSAVANPDAKKLTTAVKAIELPDGQRNRAAWMRSEIMKLVSY